MPKKKGNVAQSKKGRRQGGSGFKAQNTYSYGFFGDSPSPKKRKTANSTGRRATMDGLDTSALPNAASDGQASKRPAQDGTRAAKNELKEMLPKARHRQGESVTLQQAFLLTTMVINAITLPELGLSHLVSYLPQSESGRGLTEVYKCIQRTTGIAVSTTLRLFSSFWRRRV